MKKIYFQVDEELIYFCEILFRIQDEIDVQWKRDKDWGNQLLLIEDNIDEYDMIACFVEVFIYFRLNRLIKKIAHDHYYYTNVDEIERIGQLTNWILYEQYFERLLFEKYDTLKAYLIALFGTNVVRNQPIYFDSVITFNLKPLMDCLKQAVGYGIDEMKQEENHQNFIQSIREYIMSRKSKIDVLYIVQDDSFSFYKGNGKQYTRMELRALMYEAPLYLLGLDEYEMNLSPVITLLPNEIYIYGDYPSEPKILTLINLFHERVQLFPKNQFPFQLNVK